MYRDPAPTDDPKEQAVNVFAARLLAPAIVLRDIGVTNAEQIARYAKYPKQQRHTVCSDCKCCITEKSGFIGARIFLLWAVPVGKRH